MEPAYSHVWSILGQTKKERLCLLVLIPTSLSYCLRICKEENKFSHYAFASNKTKQATKAAAIDNYSPEAEGTRAQVRSSGKTCLREGATHALPVAVETEDRFSGV